MRRAFVARSTGTPGITVGTLTVTRRAVEDVDLYAGELGGEL
ncbi:MAG: hypothetical protein WC972_14305 [Trueperaceae bacterium]